MTSRTIVFTGIGGIGMSALAQMLTEQGDIVIGTDRGDSPVTDMLRTKGITVHIGQKAENVPDDAVLLVYSDAVPEENPERVRASELGIPQLSYFEALGAACAMKRVIAVAGTHGKTTTTGMLTHILHNAGAEPTAVIGSIMQEFGTNYLSGSSDLFVVEACEYKRHFLSLSPEILLITNIEFDHTDYFQDLADVQDAFRTLAKRVPAHGAIIADLENPAVIPVLEGLEAQLIDYTKQPDYALSLIGEFNQMNAKAAAAAAQTVLPKLSEDILRKSLSAFKGTWRRFEYKGKTKSGADVYDDYAHHPSAIRETLRAAREKFDGRILVAFHPHLYSRTKDLLDGFARSFSDADMTFIAPIFPAREIDDGTISSEILAARIRDEGDSAQAYTSLEEVEEALAKEAHEGDLVITMGAGDIYKVADNLVK